jgi:uncharacterized membrane protein YdjX (TVP38/TMEM64 family)
MTKKKRVLAVLKILTLFLIIVALPLIVYFTHPEIVHYFRDREALTAYLKSNLVGGAIVYVVLQIMQIIISFIPGQIIQVAGGYIFGLGFCLALTAVGTIVGEFVAFKLAGVLGRDFVFMIAGEERAKSFIKGMSSRRGFVAIILIYLLPGIPKDVFTYVAGLTDLKVLPFLVVSTLSRLPGVVGTIFMGHFVAEKNYVAVGVLLGFAGLVLLAAFIKRKSITSLIDKAYEMSNREKAIQG